MKNIIPTIALVFFCTITQTVYSQINSVLYDLQYTEESNDTLFYDFSIVIASGSAVTPPERVQFNSQVSMLRPVESEIEIVQSYMPLLDNQNYQGTVATTWEVNMSVEGDLNGQLIGVNIITPSLNPVNFFNNLSAGQRVRLFTVALSGQDLCPSDLRLFDNIRDGDIDNSSGADFSNGYAIGNVTQLYSANQPSQILSLENVAICTSSTSTMSISGTCPMAQYQYEWSTGETAPSIEVGSGTPQTYQVTVTTSAGYYQELSASSYSIDLLQLELDQAQLCVGDTYATGLQGGSLESASPDIATVNQLGEILATGAGTATLVFTDPNGGCSAELIININPLADVTIQGPDTICIGATTLAVPSSIGVWYSANPSIATISNDGTITGISEGQATFVFQDLSTGCEVTNSEVIVTAGPPLIIDEERICVGRVTMVSSPNSDVVFISDNTLIATITNGGVITAITPGICTIIGTDASTGCSSTIQLEATSSEATFAVGPDSICVGATTLIEASLSGTWSSSDNDVATITNQGLITGVAQGVTAMQFWDEELCLSEPITIVVSDKQKTAIIGNDSICLGGANQLMPSTGGIWTSSNIDIVWTAGEGIVNAQELGISTMIFTDTLPNCEVISDDIVLTVVDIPTISINSPTEICNRDPIEIDTDGEITVISGNTEVLDDGTLIGLTGTVEIAGISQTGCSSDTITIVVLPTDNIEFEYFEEMSTGSNQTINQSVPGIWTSDNELIATVDLDGYVVAHTFGVVTLTFEPFSAGCYLPQSISIQVFDLGIVRLTSDTICISESTQAIFDPVGTPGTWTSEHPDIATIDALTGLITGTGIGQTSIHFAPTDPNLETRSASIVVDFPILEFESDIICEDDATTIFVQAGDSLVISPINEFSIEQLSPEVYSVRFWQPIEYEVYSVSRNFTGCQSQVEFVTPVRGPYLEYGSPLEIQVGDTLEFFTNAESILLLSDSTVASILEPHSIIGESPGTVVVTASLNNGCDSYPVTVEVLARPCNGFELTDDFMLTGTAFNDSNGDSQLGADETRLRNAVITISPGDMTVLTDDEGKYFFEVENPGTYALSAIMNTGIWERDTLHLDNIEVEEQCNHDLNFGFVSANVSDPMVSLSLSNSILRCDWLPRFTFTIQNEGPMPVEGTLEFIFDDETAFETTDITQYEIMDNVFEGVVAPIDGFNTQQYEVILKMPQGSSVLPVLEFTANLISDEGEILASYAFSDQLRCSYDPNDKRAYPDRDGEDNLTLFDEELEYTIRFQNNGNDTAFQVKIIDPLDEAIDPRSIGVVASSHDVQTSIEESNLIFFFEDINLVDSMTNYDGSQGFVTFRCRVKPDLEEGTTIENRADIIFDTNKPIVTNQTINTMVTQLCVNSSATTNVSICFGEDYNGYTESGTYEEVYALPYGCDSIVITVLEVQSIETTDLLFEICEGEVVTIDGAVIGVTESTTLVDTSYSSAGCISEIRTIDIDIEPVTFITIDTTICEGFDYRGYTTTGTYVIESIDNATGCPLIETIMLTVLSASDPLCTVSTSDLPTTEPHIYPNPASLSITITSTTPFISLKILDTKGALIQKEAFIGSTKEDIDISNLETGMYIIVLTSSNGRITSRRFAKE